MDKLNIAIFVDFDNIEIGVKSTLRREFHVGPVLDALKERGVIAAKFAYANWGRQEWATRQMAENAVQMVQRIPSPRGDKNGADINLALDALEMAFTHKHINGFAIVSGDSDFIPLVNKLKEYGKTVFIVGGKAFTSTILQQNCSEFISYESLLDDGKFTPAPQQQPPQQQQPQQQQQQPRQQGGGGGRQERRVRPEPLDLAQAMPLVERALDVLERREVQPQLGLLKSTMLQLSPTFSERAYGSQSFSTFVDSLGKAGYINVTGTGGKSVIERKGTPLPETPRAANPEDALPALAKVLADHGAELAAGATADVVEAWVSAEAPRIEWKGYGYQEFAELLNFAQDRGVVRIEPDEDRGLLAYPAPEPPPPAEAPSDVAPLPEDPFADSPFAEDEPLAMAAGVVPRDESEITPEELDMLLSQPEPEPAKKAPSSRRRRKPSGGGGGGNGGGNRPPAKKAAVKKGKKIE